MPASAFTSRSLVLRASLLALAVAGLSGCQSIAGTQATSPQLRLVDAATDPTLPGLDFYLGSTGLAYNLGPGTKTSYVPLASGNYTLSVTRDGFSNQVLASAGLGVSSSQHYTAVVGGNAATLGLTILTDQNTSAPTNQFSMRVLDQSANIGAVDIYFVPSGGKLITTSAAITNFTFGTNSGYLSLPAGTYQIVILPAGTVPIATTVTLYTGPLVTYAAGSVRTTILLDVQNVTTPGVNVLTLADYDPPGA